MSYETPIKFADIREGDFIRHEVRAPGTSEIVSTQRIARVFTENTNEWWSAALPDGYLTAAEWHDDPQNGHRLFRIKR